MLVTYKNIQSAEKILLKKGQTFDNEGQDFIKNFSTIDLQAVPGSGKTTALLAKLLILENHLPFKNGAGILVISHTNAAVDEIKNKISKYCPKLFAYPNFIGTIQSFVDQFLAIPCGHSILKTRFSLIDNDIFKNRLWKKFKNIYWDKTYEKPGVFFWQRHINKASQQSNNDESLAKQICNKLIEKEAKTIFFDFNDNKIKTFPNKVVLSDSNNQKFKGIKKIIDELLNEGIISYEYSYILAKYYLKNFPIIKKLLQTRFPYVFVDEMQDMYTHQYNLLEEIFYRDKPDKNVYQRIGDKNQAIFENVKDEEVWQDREKKLPLKGSYRLSPNTANIVKYFGLEFQEIKGNNQTDIKPHIIIFDDDSKNKVIDKFCEIIKQHQKNKQIPIQPEHPFEVIGWRKEVENNGDENKLGIKNFFPQFEPYNSKLKIDYPSLKSYLKIHDKNKQDSLHDINKNIINALLKILRLENIYTITKRNYTKTQLLKFLRELEDKSIYENFKLKLYLWSMKIYQGDKITPYEEIKEFLSDFLKYFNLNQISNESQNFIDNSEERQEGLLQQQNYSNIHKYDENISVEIGTVHSVKGQTHTATLYLETYYTKAYESERLLEQFKGVKIKSTETKKTVKQSAKMVYVGFSRPTHLLCFAVHKNRFDKKISSDVWKIEDITSNFTDYP